MAPLSIIRCPVKGGIHRISSVRNFALRYSLHPLQGKDGSAALRQSCQQGRDQFELVPGHDCRFETDRFIFDDPLGIFRKGLKTDHPCTPKGVASRVLHDLHEVGAGPIGMIDRLQGGEPAVSVLNQIVDVPFTDPVPPQRAAHFLFLWDHM